MSEALAGFADANVVLIALLFVIGEGLVRTGVAQRLGDWLVAKAGSSETRLLVLLMLVVGGLGSVMSSTGVVAIFIPIVLRIAQNTGTAPSRLMMPLSVAALISGMMTLVATAPNLVVDAELRRSGAGGFEFFSFTPFGLPVLALGILYMLFARRWLAAQVDSGDGRSSRPRLRDWIEAYGLAGRERRVRIKDGSPLAGRTLEELRLRDQSGANLLAVEREGRFAPEVVRPVATTRLRSGDVLLIDLFVADANAEDLARELGLELLPLSGAYFTDRAQEVGMVEVMLPEGSSVIGRTLVRSEFRTRYDVTAIGLRRGNEARSDDITNQELRVGDTLLVAGFWSDIRKLQTFRRDMIVLDLPAELDEVLPAASRAPQALLCLLLVVGLMVSGVVPNVQAALIGCLLMGALALHRLHQRLPVDPLGQPDPDRRHAAVLARPATHRRRRPRRRGADRRRRWRRAARGAGQPVRDHGHPRPVHLQHGDRRPDGAGGPRHGRGSRRLALPVRDDRRPGGLGRVHDARYLRP